MQFSRNILFYRKEPEENPMDTRHENDSLGGLEIPADAYFGIQTYRACKNFPVSGLRPKPLYIDATVHIKKAAALVNGTLGLLPEEKSRAIVAASNEILDGGLREWFVVDVFQAGAGTSHNMNVNEVIANRAIELLGGSKGDYSIIHPNDDVNMAQSTNDVCPTAIRIGGLMALELLTASLSDLREGFFKKGEEFDHVIKSGRTHLHDAVPIRLGQEFHAYGTCMQKHLSALGRAAESSLELGIGGTAVGTGLNAHAEYRPLVIRQLSAQTGHKFVVADDPFEAMQSLRPIVELSGAVRNAAQDLIRISNDIRLLSSGPKTGLAEIILPAVQPGSSIMPGKVNPVMAEMLGMVCFQVIGCDTAILLAAQAGQLELNVMMPLVAYNLIHEIEILAHGVERFATLCVKGISANEQRCREYAENSMSIVTVLNPHIGYQRAAKVAQQYLRSGKSIREILLEDGVMTEKELDELFDLRKLTEPGIHGKKS